MREHNNLYYVFLWDAQRNVLSLDKIEQIKRIIFKASQALEPKQHSPPHITKKE
ncbi:MAG: hypothetical protein J6J39_03955 [Clostridia bacterium]|nr:hypothetical protein [Clostridia bacterium]